MTNDGGWEKKGLRNDEGRKLEREEKRVEKEKNRSSSFWTNSGHTEKNSSGMNTSPDYDFLIKLLALGDSGVGKTSLLFNFTGNFCLGLWYSIKFFERVGVNFLKYSILYFGIILEFWLDDLGRMDYPVKIIAWVNLKVNTKSVPLNITTVVKWHLRIILIHG